MAKYQKSTEKNIREREEVAYEDLEQNYVNQGYYIDWFSVPTGKSVQFKGKVTSFSDKFEQSWNEQQVYGRSDKILNFQSTTRVISLSWDVIAASESEAIENLQRVSLLISFLYPVYSSVGNDVSTISAAPLFKLSFANLIKSHGNTKKKTIDIKKGSSASVAEISGLLGKVSGFNYEPDFESGFFTVDGKLYPQMISLSCEFTVQHQTKLGWSKAGKPFSNNFPYGEEVKEISGNPKSDVVRSGKSYDSTNNIKKAKEGKILK